ncbi:hypothetical protein HMPREF1624_05072 [Sporothrix schenckii ATCC 58251]|uniref:Uncharacterized protein n=1 Tax=Sporothrix schenckii (strain ATCC 58251 / de Perez 2211183) TaxID=1391915 RepID=U7PRL2_SPOS1|nr:hypothetical protein HMPREF1624_05072 [Sporothrix schenckii ATCC 58251]
MSTSMLDIDKEAARQKSLLEDNGAARASSTKADKTMGEQIVDALPIPSTAAPVTDPDTTARGSHVTDTPTLSHELAVDGQPGHDKGAAQQAHKTNEVADLGWHDRKQDIVSPLVGGLGNEELWLLTRRFNKQMYHVKAVETPVPGNLDLNIADEEEFSPDKLRANLERLYMTVGMGMLAAYKHVARIRSWRETPRTATFAGVYLVAWLLDGLVPLGAATLIALIVSPWVREVMFPPAPLALVGSDGGVQKPRAGVLGSHDSATGAPENHKGEAAEAEATNFANTVASVALASAAGKHPQGDPNNGDYGDDGDNGSGKDEKGGNDTVPDPTALATGVADAKDVARGGQPSAKHDKTKVPMETAVWTKMRPVMHGLADVADTWERMGNALSPTPPFPGQMYRLRLAAVLVPLFLVSLLVSSYMFTKGVTLGAGLGFFGDPVLSRGLSLLNRKFPRWQKLFELRNTLLKGVPTNAQLTLTLLRIGEANKAPLPPPPRRPADNAPPPMQPASVTDADLRSTGAGPPLNATPAELDAVMSHTESAGAASSNTGEADINAGKDASHGKKGSRLLGLFKGTTKGTVKAALGTNSLRAALGSRHAKERQGVVEPASGDADLTSGPVEFQARYEGKRGSVYITAKATIPAVAFSTEVSSDPDTVHPRWSIPIGDIQELKKIGGFGWKTKIVVGWSLGREMADGLEITERTGTTYKVTAIPLRDELFNRLVAIGGQKWEAW